jgi:hypothetical protein
MRSRPTHKSSVCFLSVQNTWNRILLSHEASETRRIDPPGKGSRGSIGAKDSEPHREPNERIGEGSWKTSTEERPYESSSIPNQKGQCPTPIRTLPQFNRVNQ